MLRRIILSLALAAFTLIPVGTVAAQGRTPVTKPVGTVAAEGRTPAIKSESTSRIAFDRSKFPRDRQKVEQGGSFPYLNGDYEVLASGTGLPYNCIAHSLGIHDRWVNPQTGPSSNPLSLMDQMYRAKGYSRVKGMDISVTSGVQKLVVYATVTNGRINQVTHAAVQERSGTWTSKLGKLALIRHRNPEALNGPVYGQPVAVYVRSAR